MSPRERLRGRRGTARAAAWLIAAGLLASGGCAGAQSERTAGRDPGEGPPAKRGTDVRDALRADVVFPSGRRFAAEIADTPERVARGYMFRRDVGPNDGMVFVFPEPGAHFFWMKDTMVPLDMIWMEDDFRVVHIEHAVPPCRSDPCPSYGPMRKVRYVLEVRGGTAREEGLAIGDHLRITFPESGR